MYDPTVKTTVDEVMGSIENPGQLIEETGNDHAAFELNHSLILVGNDPASDIVLKTPKATDYIAEISHENGMYVLRRLDERSVVNVEGKSVQEYILADGDEIQLDERKFRYRAPVQTPNQ